MRGVREVKIAGSPCVCCVARQYFIRTFYVMVVGRLSGILAYLARLTDRRGMKIFGAHCSPRKGRLRN